jgi:hypothetical protein
MTGNRVNLTSRPAALRLVAVVVAATALWPTVARAQASPAGRGPDEWYVRLTVRSGTLIDSTNALGRLDDSLDGWDSHDLVEMPPIGPPYLTIVFPHPEWGAHAGDYTTDYRQARPGAGGAWGFEVRSDLPRTITITWQLYAPAGSTVLARSLLVDVDSGGLQVVPEPQGSYTVAMVGPVHRLTWQVNARPVVDAGPDVQILNGDEVSLPPATFTDEDPADTHTAEVNWGDGTVEPGVVDQGAHQVTASHVFTTLGQFLTEVCVTDSGGATGCGDFTVSVACRPGDVNGSGAVTREDHAALVGLLYDGPPQPCADVRPDATLDVADLAAEVSLLAPGR